MKVMDATGKEKIGTLPVTLPAGFLVEVTDLLHELTVTNKITNLHLSVGTDETFDECDIEE
jgi:hypothetical protein